MGFCILTACLGGLFLRVFCMIFSHSTIIFCFPMKIGIFIISALYSNNNGNKLNSVLMR